jgi:hypothetical protein
MRERKGESERIGGEIERASLVYILKSSSRFPNEVNGRETKQSILKLRSTCP